MDLFFQIFIMIVFVSLRNNLVGLSQPIGHSTTYSAFGNNYVASGSGLAIICLTWAAIVTIGWSFYFGFRGRNRNAKDNVSEDGKSYEYRCCARIPKRTPEPVDNTTREQSYPKSAPNQQSKSYSKKQRYGDTTSNPTYNAYKPIQTQYASMTQSQPISNKPPNVPSEQSRPSKMPEQGATVPCQPTRYTKMMTPPSQISHSEKGVCLCCHKKAHPNADLTERPSTTSQFSQKILQEDVQTVSKSIRPINRDIPQTDGGYSKKYDYDHVRNATPSRENLVSKEFKPESKEITCEPLDNSTKVMRPVPTYSPITNTDRPMPTKSPEMYSTPNLIHQGSQVRPPPSAPYQNVATPQSHKSLVPVCEKNDPQAKGSCCGQKERKCTGSIRPIIDAYRVEGNLRMKGKINRETFSIPADTYEVIPQ